MNRRSIFSIILALAIILSTLVMSASALLTGDIDADNTVSASDARVVLRASVGLENLSAAQKKLADADADGSVSAADARLILRASVGLESLGEQTAEHPAYHTFNKISMTGETKCSFNGCNATLPSFNSIVNSLKTSENGVNRYTEIIEYVDFTDKTEISGSLAFMMKDEENVAKTETSYEIANTNRFLTDNNFPTKGEKFVSALTDSDVKSTKVEKVSSIDFIKALPDTFKVSGKSYDLKPLKSADFPEVYKITVVIPEETADLTKKVTGTSVFDKIYLRNYNAKIEETRSMLATEIEKESQQFSELGMKYSGTIKSLLTVEYFVDASTFTPVAARYSHTFRNSFSVEIPVFLKMKQAMDITENNCYVFNPTFTLTK